MSLEMGQHALAFVILCLVSKADSQIVAGPKPSMSKLDAVKQCSTIGATLLSYKNINANPSGQEYLSKLGDGEFAWIEGYAKLSPFLSWQGCFNTTNINYLASMRVVSIEAKSIYRCWEACPGYEYMYIGIKDRSCYCILQDQRHAIRNTNVNDSYCSFSCNNNVIDSCGGHSYMSVYAILDNGRIHWAATEPSSQLCVYVKRKRLKFEAFIASCHTLQSDLINGYICTNNAWSRMSKTNCTSQTAVQGTYCIMDDISSRTEASEGCFRKNGMLADLGAEADTPVYLKHNFRYWIGIHRTFETSETYRDGETVCLSATRVGNMLYLEPDDCSAQKYYLCESNSKDHTKTILTSTMSHSRKTEEHVPDINQTSAPTVYASPNRELETKAESPIPYVVPSVLMVIFVILLILFIVYRRHKKRRNQTTRKLEDNNDAIYETDNIKNEQSFSSDPGQNTADSKCLIVKSKPDKPERLTLKRRTVTNEYENFTLKGNTTETTEKKKEKRYKDKDDEYDKLKFNSMPRNIKGGHEESNVHNHMVGTNNDNYDTMKSTKSFNSVGRVDETYSRMNDRLVLNDYCGLKESTKVHGSIENADNASYNLKLEQPAATLEDEQPRRFIILDDDEEDLSTEMNDTKPEEQECNANITYTEIAHSPENIKCTEIAGARCESNNENKTNFKEFERDNNK